MLVHISFRILFLPIPSVTAHVVEGSDSHPVENGSGFVCVGPEFGQVAVAARSEFILY